MRGFVASVCVIAMMGSASAQPPQPPQPQPQAQPPQPQPQVQPPAQPQQPAPWYRLTLNDGRVVDVEIIGGDATSYHVRMAGATYSLPRANVVSSIALQPATMYTPQGPPPPPPVAQPIDENRDPFSRHRRAAGFAYFGAAYLITMPIALARRDNDSHANAGLIPVVGPLIWTLAEDDNDPFEDGWDWLAAADTLIQGMGLYLVITGGKDSSTQKTVRLVPVSGRGQHGFALGGTF